MSFTDVFRNIAGGMGKLIGGSFGALGSLRRALVKLLGKLRPQSSKKEIRSIVIDELTRFATGDSELTKKQLEERLQLMADTILALQEKIDELSARGVSSDTLVSAAMASVEDVNLLGDEEKAILTSIFRQNIAIQKPELIKTTVGRV
jgi:hypothetical protein